MFVVNHRSLTATAAIGVSLCGLPYGWSAQQESRPGPNVTAESHSDAGRVAVETVANPPPIQMLVPGFSVRELPVALKNINNVQYRSDGKLVALGYNGHIHLLSDTDGDRLEDRAEPFWDRDTLRGPIGLAVTPPGYRHGNGVFAASKGKLSLIVDQDGDDRAEEEIVVASGWEEIPQNVDAVGVALDSAGNIYFALGTANYANGYLIDQATGRSHYDLGSERGTILKVSPDFARREIVCTGVRFPVSLGFNRHGDLFCTDQEGATWLPNGNPFDELLHIQPGRHYGFPPRHPRHLPDVIDEPSVFDFTPQHQSTCGFIFNEPVRGGSSFGPSWWADNALVTGESRGKIWRTKLIKTDVGYVAQNQLIACLNALTTDVCLSPQGDLVVSTHSGKPDWGTGPNGLGKLYKIHYSAPEKAQPRLAWSGSATELHIAFDRPLDHANLRELVHEAKVTQGKAVQAGDRFESIRPGYQVVQNELAIPRYGVPVLSAGVSADRRTLILTTPPRSSAVNYAIELPSSIVGSSAAGGATRASGSQPPNGHAQPHPQIDLAADLTGVQARWIASDSEQSWAGWLPHLDLAVARILTAGSAEHDRFWEMSKQPGKLTLRGQLDLFRMLQPAIQPGSTLDHEYAPETVTLVFDSRGAIQVNAPELHSASRDESAGLWIHRITHESRRPDWVRFDLTLTTGAGEPSLRLSWHTLQDTRQRALPLRRFLLPWAQPSTEPVQLFTQRTIPELAGGDWLRGRRLFFSEDAACFKCHTVLGEGRKLGPDLTNLIHRDYASVLRDIREPTAALNPDHIAFQVELGDGESLTGVLLSESDDLLVVGDAAGTHSIRRASVHSVTPSAVSLMPEGLDQALGEQGLKDLLRFLLTRPLEPGPIESPGAPAPRSRRDVEALLATCQPPPDGLRPMHIILCAGPKDHGPGEHDYPLWQRRWTALLSLAEGVTVSQADVWPSAEQFAAADVIVFFNNNPGWNEVRGRELDAYLERGAGAVYFHWAIEARAAAERFARRIGLASNSQQTKYRHGPIDLEFHDHPLARGFNHAHFTRSNFVDETYWNLMGDPSRVSLLASAVEDGAARPQIWTTQPGAGRVFVALPGHYNWTFDDPIFRVLALRGICWASGQPVDRLAALAVVGARLAD